MHSIKTTVHATYSKGNNGPTKKEICDLQGQQTLLLHLHIETLTQLSQSPRNSAQTQPMNV